MSYDKNERTFSLRDGIARSNKTANRCRQIPGGSTKLNKVQIQTLAQNAVIMITIWRCKKKQIVIETK